MPFPEVNLLDLLTMLGKIIQELLIFNEMNLFSSFNDYSFHREGPGKKNNYNNTLKPYRSLLGQCHCRAYDLKFKFGSISATQVSEVWY